MVGSGIVGNGCPVIGFVGPSGAGKTTLLAAVVSALERRDLWVGVVKHACHEVYPDQPGKDSARLYEAGAEVVALAGPNQIATFVRRRMPSRLTDVLVGLPPGLDVVLVEGFSWEEIPRYVVLPPGVEPSARYVERGAVLRTIVAPAPRDGEAPAFAADLVEELASEIASYAGKSTLPLPTPDPVRNPG